MKLTSCQEDLLIHRNICPGFPTGGSKSKKRKAKNQKVTNFYRINPFTGAREKNTLTFRRSQLFKCLKPLTLSSLDLETLSNPITDKDRPAPSGAQDIHSVFCYSMAHCSLYEEKHPLPQTLKNPRGLMFDPSTQSESDFALKLIKQIRTDMKLLSDFLHEALSKDQGTPSFHSLSPIEKAAFTLQTSCCFCGRRFGSSFIDPVTKRRRKVIKCIDHDHLLQTSQLAR